MASALTAVGRRRVPQGAVHGGGRRPAVVRRRPVRRGASAVCGDQPGLGRLCVYRRIHGGRRCGRQRLRRHGSDLCRYRKAGQSRRSTSGSRVTWCKNLSMGVMARYESYDSFGSKTVWKFNTIWHVTDMVALRAHDRHRLPRTVARTEQRPGGDDELRSGRVDPAGHLPGDQRRGTVLRRRAAEARDLEELRRRHRAHADAELHGHDRRLPDRRDRSHRAVAELRCDYSAHRGQSAAAGTRPGRRRWHRAVLHQWVQHAGPRASTWWAPTTW